MKKQQAIEKYNLKHYDGKCDFLQKVYFELWQNSTNENGVEIYYNLDNQTSIDLDNGKTYFLTIQKIDKNKMIFDKRLGGFRPKLTTKCVEIVEEQANGTSNTALQGQKTD